MDVQQLTTKLKDETGQTIKEVFRLKSRKSATTNSFLIVTLKRKDKYQIRPLEKLGNVRVAWKRYKKTQLDEISIIHCALYRKTREQVVLPKRQGRSLSKLPVPRASGLPAKKKQPKSRTTNLQAPTNTST